MGVKTVGDVVAEEVLRGLVKAVGLQAVTTGLHNAIDGQCLYHAGYHCNDKQLGQMLEHLDSLNSIAQKIERANRNGG